jgi:hypothetical protein
MHRSRLPSYRQTRARVEAEDESEAFVASDAPPASSMKATCFVRSKILRDKFVLSEKIIS